MSTKVAPANQNKDELLAAIERLVQFVDARAIEADLPKNSFLRALKAYQLSTSRRHVGHKDDEDLAQLRRALQGSSATPDVK